MDMDISVTDSWLRAGLVEELQRFVVQQVSPASSQYPRHDLVMIVLGPGSFFL